MSFYSAYLVVSCLLGCSPSGAVMYREPLQFQVEARACHSPAYRVQGTNGAVGSAKVVCGG